MRNITLTTILSLSLLGSVTGCVSETDRSSESVVSEPDSDPVASTGTVRFVNVSDISVYYLYVSPSSTSSWGPDQLGSNVLSPGESFTLRGVPCGNIDFKVEGFGHTTLLTRYGVPLGCGSGLDITLR
jgi:hypothetical protein